MSDSKEDKAKFKIVSYAGHAQDPTWFTTAPVEAMKKALDKANLKLEDIDLFETSLEYVSSIAGINWEKNK